jgi:hypothetical protein
VFTEFKRRLSTGAGVLSLTTNAVFGQYWRALCRYRDDERLIPLQSLLSQTLAAMAGAEREQVSEWLAASYNMGEEIQEIVRACAKQFPALVLESDLQHSSAEMMEIARVPTAAAQERVSRLLTHLRVVADPELVRDCAYLPLTLEDAQLFSLLPHLMSRGCMFSLRPSVLMASIAARTDGLLSKRALAFLESMRGRWFDVELPENQGLAFCHMALSVPEMLTLAERSYLSHYRRLHGLRINREAEVQVRTAYSPHLEALPDHMLPCSSCGFQRSFTLMLADGQCGLCVSESRLKNCAPPLGDSQSMYVQCATCTSLYAVVDVEALNGTAALAVFLVLRFVCSPSPCCVHSCLLLCARLLCVLRFSFSVVRFSRVLRVPLPNTPALLTLSVCSALVLQCAPSAIHAACS